MNEELREFVSGLAPDIQELVTELRALVLDVVTDAVETVQYGKAIGYGVGPKMSDLVCVIAPQKFWVNLGMYGAVGLPDPENLLEGTGKLHRHVKIQTAADVGRPAVRALVEAALAVKDL
jgi:hypothetical protein